MEMTEILKIINGPLYGYIYIIKMKIPFGPERIKVGLILRESKFLHGILYSIEAWHNFPIREVLKFERLDQILIRNICFRAHSKMPIEFLHMETSMLKIRFILASRRIMYLKSILQKDSQELMLKIYFAQKSDPLKGDFYKLVQEDKNLIDLNMEDDDILSMGLEQFRNILKNKVTETCIKYLNKVQKP